MGKAKDSSTEKGTDWPQSFYSGFNLFVFLILSVVWAKLTPVRENSGTVPLCTDSRTFTHYHTYKRTKVPDWLQTAGITPRAMMLFIFVQVMGKIWFIWNRRTSSFPYKVCGAGDMVNEITCMNGEIHFGNALEIIPENQRHSMLNSSSCIHCAKEKLVSPRSHPS